MKVSRLTIQKNWLIRVTAPIYALFLDYWESALEVECVEYRILSLRNLGEEGVTKIKILGVSNVLGAVFRYDKLYSRVVAKKITESVRSFDVEYHQQE